MRRSTALVLFLLVTLAGCRHREPVVASFGDVRLEAWQFEDAYRRFATSSPVRDGLEPRRQYALRMIERELVADRARRERLDTLAAIRAYVERAVEMAQRRAYLEQEIGAGIPDPPESDVREAFQRGNTRLRLQQIYAATRRESDSLYALLQAGVPFDSLAAGAMRRYGVPYDSIPGHMGWITYDDMDEAPEEAAFALESGAVSRPVESLQGWHIFRVLERSEILRMDASAFEAARERLTFRVRQRRFDEASARRIRDLVRAADLVTDADALRAAWSAVAPALRRFDPSGPVLAFEQELAEVRGAQPDRPVAWVDGRAFTTGRFIRSLPDVPRAYWGGDPRRVLEITIRDSLLTALARAEGYGDDPSVERRRRTAESEILYQIALYAVADTLDLDRIRPAFYREYRDRLFVDHVVTRYRALTFEDSLAAREALRALTAGGAEADRIAGGAVTRSHRSDAGADDPAARLPEDRVPAWSGPFRRDDAWELLSLVERTPEYVPYDSVDVATYLQSRLFEVVHGAALPPEYDPDDVVLDDQVLLDALPLE